VSANTDSGFSIVKYNTSGTVVTVGHGLNKEPDLIIVKETAGGNDWFVYNSARGALYNLRLNATDAEANQNSVWNSTAPTTSVFTSGTFFSSSNVMAYCFAEIAGFSKIGSYTGNGSGNGPECHDRF
jgi:hypothetical protein